MKLKMLLPVILCGLACPAGTVVYDRALNAQKLTRIRHYLADKYGFGKESQLWETDFNHSRRTDLVDFALFAQHWLAGI